MAEIQSPISGGLKVVRRTVSADSFVKAAPDPVTTNLLQRNSSALGSVSSQLSSLTQQINSLNTSMQSVYANITQSAELERRKSAQEQELQRRLSEQQLREGKESVIERKIQTALVSPVQKIGQKASFTLSRLMGFFTTLLGGWLLNQGIQAINAYQKGNKDKLQDIRDNVIKNLGIIGGIYAGIRVGLTSVFNVLTRVAARVSSAVAINLFQRPVQALIDGVRGAAEKFKLKFNKPKENPPPKTSPSETQTNTGPAKTVAEAEERVSGKGMNRFAASTLFGGFLGGTFDIMKGEDPTKAYASNMGGAAVSTGAANLASKIAPGPFKLPAALAAGFFSYGPATDFFKGLYDKGSEFFGGNKSLDQSSLSKPMSNKTTNVAFNTDNLMNDKNQNIATNLKQTDFTKPPDYGDITVAQLMGDTTGSNINQAAQITPIKQNNQMKAKDVGPLPEPAPNIIPFPIGGQSSPTVAKGPNSSGGIANDIPSIDPENYQNNILLTYSHSVYNIPMT